MGGFHFFAGSWRSGVPAVEVSGDYARASLDGSTLLLEGTVFSISGGKPPRSTTPDEIAAQVLRHVRETRGFRGIEGQFTACFVDGGEILGYRSHLCASQLYYSGHTLSNRLLPVYVDEKTPTPSTDYLLRFLVDSPSLQYGSEHTPIREIRRLKPGETVRLSPGEAPSLGRTSFEAYRFFSDPKQRAQDVAPTIRKLLEDGIEERISRASGRAVGMELSGGLDSSFTSAIVGSKVKGAFAYLYTYPDNPSHRASEQYAQTVADRFGIRLRMIDPRTVTSPDLGAPLAYRDEPVDFYWQGAQFGPAVQSLIPENALVFSGFGSDQLFMRKPSVVLTLLRKREYRSYLRTISEMARSKDRSASYFVWQSLLAMLPRDRFYRATEKFRRWRINPFTISDISFDALAYEPISWIRYGGDPFEATCELLGEGERLEAATFEGDFPHPNLYYLVAPRLVLEPYTEPHGAQYCYPYCDRRLIDFVFRNVSWHLIHDWKNPYKSLLREAQVGLVPESVRTRPKNDFSTDGFYYNLLRHNQHYLRRLLSQVSESYPGLLDAVQVQACFEKLLFGIHANEVFKLGRLIAFALWSRDLHENAACFRSRPRKSDGRGGFL